MLAKPCIAKICLVVSSKTHRQPAARRIIQKHSETLASDPRSVSMIHVEPRLRNKGKGNNTPAPWPEFLCVARQSFLTYSVFSHLSDFLLWFIPPPRCRIRLYTTSLNQENLCLYVRMQKSCPTCTLLQPSVSELWFTGVCNVNWLAGNGNVSSHAMLFITTSPVYFSFLFNDFFGNRDLKKICQSYWSQIRGNNKKLYPFKEALNSSIEETETFCLDQIWVTPPLLGKTVEKMVVHR